MSELDLKLARCVINKVRANGASYSRDTLSVCYYEVLNQSGGQERPEASEKWIDYTWGKLKKLPFENLSNAGASDKKLAELMMEVLGK